MCRMVIIMESGRKTEPRYETLFAHNASFKVFETDKNKVAIDLFMYGPIDAVKDFAVSKIQLLGANGRV